MDENFKLKECKRCGGRNPYCPECNDMGGFNENDDYKSTVKDKPISKCNSKQPLRSFHFEELHNKRNQIAHLIVVYRNNKPATLSVEEFYGRLQK